jgi:uncharacterized membrane-anchored protein YhcB (DUF1043 family)
MSTAIPNGEITNWKILLANWIFHQGVSTVLLFALVAAIGYIGPREIDKNRTDIKELRSEFSTIIEKQREDLKAEHNDSHELIKELTEAIRDLQIAIRGGHNS